MLEKNYKNTKKNYKNGRKNERHHIGSKFNT